MGRGGKNLWKDWEGVPGQDPPADLFWKLVPKYIKDDELSKRFIRFLSKCWNQARLDTKLLVSGQKPESLVSEIQIGDGSANAVRAGFVKGFIGDVIFRQYQACNGMDMGLDQAGSLDIFMAVCCHRNGIPQEISEKCKEAPPDHWPLVEQAVNSTFNELFKSENKQSGGSKKRSGGGGSKGSSGNAKKAAEKEKSPEPRGEEPSDKPWWRTETSSTDQWQDRDSSGWQDMGSSGGWQDRSSSDSWQDSWGSSSWDSWSRAPQSRPRSRSRSSRPRARSGERSRGRSRHSPLLRPRDRQHERQRRRRDNDNDNNTNNNSNSSNNNTSNNNSNSSNNNNNSNGNDNADDSGHRERSGGAGADLLLRLNNHIRSARSAVESARSDGGGSRKASSKHSSPVSDSRRVRPKASSKHSSPVSDSRRVRPKVEEHSVPAKVEPSERHASPADGQGEAEGEADRQRETDGEDRQREADGEDPLHLLAAEETVKEEEEEQAEENVEDMMLMESLQQYLVERLGPLEDEDGLVKEEPVNEDGPVKEEPEDEDQGSKTGTEQWYTDVGEEVLRCASSCHGCCLSSAPHKQSSSGEAAGLVRLSGQVDGIFCHSCFHVLEKAWSVTVAPMESHSSGTASSHAGPARVVPMRGLKVQ